MDQTHNAVFVCDITREDSEIPIHIVLAPRAYPGVVAAYPSLPGLCNKAPPEGGWVRSDVSAGADPERFCTFCLSELSTYGSAKG